MRTLNARSFFSFAIALALTLSTTFLQMPAVRASSISVSVTGPTSQPGHMTQGTMYANEPFLTATGGTAPYTYSNWSLPKAVGVTLNADGTISGMTCGANGNDAASFTVTDATGATLTTSLAYVVNRAPSGACSLSTSSSPSSTATVNQPYSSSLTPSGGNGSYYCALDSGSLPPGLSVSPGSSSAAASACAISGTPTTTGTYTFVVLINDTSGASGISNSSTITVSPSGSLPLAITTSTIATPAANVAYNQTIQTSGGTAPITFALGSGALPAGLALNASTGVISGTPTTAGSFNFTITATDATHASVSQAYTGTTTAALAITTATLPAPQINTAYSETIQTAGGTTPIAFSVTSGSLPIGLALDGTTGVVSGTPSASGSYSFAVTAKDANAVTASQTYSGTIAAALAIATATLPTPVLSVPYSQTVQTSGGTAPVTFSVTSGSLPSGLSLDAASGAISGTPTAAGSYTFAITAKDAKSFTAAQTYSGTIAAGLAIATVTLPVPEVNQPYSQTVQTSGGTAAFTFAVTAGALPAGLSLDANTGVISGTAATAGAYSFTITVTDANGRVSSQAYSGSVAAPLSITTSTLPSPEANQPYTQTVQTAGGIAPFNFALSSGALPAGLTLNTATGVISGTISGSGSYTFTVTVTDSSGMVRTVTYTLTTTAALAITTTSLPEPVVNHPYKETVQTAGGVAPFSFSISAGSLPAGLTLDTSTGIISGTIRASGSYQFTVKVVDSLGITRSAAFSGAIANALLIAPGAVPSAMVAVPYSATISASGGVAPYRLSIVSGSLPTGLSFEAAGGVISGRARTAGTATFTVQAQDANGTIASNAYTLEVAPRPNPANDPDVRGLVSAQTAAMQRFASAQTDNITHHLENVHSGARCPQDDRIQLNDATRTAAVPLTLPCRAGKIDAWSAGTFSFGAASTSGSFLDFHTNGVTVGADAHLSRELVVGLALGGGFDGTSVGALGTSLRGGSFDSAAYASYHPTQNFFVDGVLGWDSATFTDNRWNTEDSSFISGRRTAHGRFTSLVAGLEYRSGRLQYAPYFRADSLTAYFDGMTESEHPIWALSFAPMQTSSTTLVGGLRAAYDLPTPLGVLTPLARLEVRGLSSDLQTQNLTYADGIGPSYVLEIPAQWQQALSGSFGARLSPNHHLLFQVDYDFSATKGSVQHTLRPYVNVSF